MKLSVGYSIQSETIRNVHVLLEYKRRLYCQILMKLSKRLPINVPSILTTSPGPSGMLMPSKNLRGDKWSLDMLPDFRSL